MTVATRTPDGLPMRCPMCGRTSAVWPALPVGDSVCPSCGCLLWFRDYFQRIAAIWPDDISRDTTFEELGADSLDIVEMIMELEEEFDVTIPDHAAEQIKSIGELIDCIERELRRREFGG